MDSMTTIPTATGMRQFAHDVKSLAAGISSLAGVIADTVHAGRPVSARAAIDLQEAARFLDELFDAVRKGTAEESEDYDLWAVCTWVALGHGRIVTYRNDRRMMVHGSRLVGARLVGVLVDNALEYGDLTQVHGTENAITFSNSLTSGLRSRPAQNAHTEALRGTGLVSAHAHAQSLGLSLDTRNDHETFTATLTRAGRAP